MENIDKNIEKLKTEYKLIIPANYVDFVKQIDMFEFSWKSIKFTNIEFELNHFLGYSKESSSQDLYMWYNFADENRLEYLTIAMGFGNEEVAIKVKGENLGEIVLITPDENDELVLVIQKICENFSEFIKILKKGEN